KDAITRRRTRNPRPGASHRLPSRLSPAPEDRSRLFLPPSDRPAPLCPWAVCPLRDAVRFPAVNRWGKSPLPGAGFRPRPCPRPHPGLTTRSARATPRGEHHPTRSAKSGDGALDSRPLSSWSTSHATSLPPGRDKAGIVSPRRVCLSVAPSPPIRDTGGHPSEGARVIRYTCSRCGKSLKAPPSYARNVGTRPRRQRPPPIPPPSTEASPEDPRDWGEDPRPAPQPVTASDDSEELFLPRQRKHSVLPLVALLGLLLLVGLSVVAVRFLFAMRSARQRE